MGTTVRVDDKVDVGGALSRADVGRLAREGYRTVIDLRTLNEEIPGGVLGVDEEGAVVEAAGMRYESVPVSLAEADEALIERVGERMREAEKPVLMHCASGKRAGAMALVNLAVWRGMTAERCFSMASSMGFDCEDEPEMKRLVGGYVERRSAAYRGAL